MNLEDQIANLTNPQEFTHICDVLSADIFKEDFEQIDDNQKDGGNDGYLRSGGRFYARHCFKKLSKRSQKEEILKKVKEDLAKVPDLIKAGYTINEWFFTTSYRMPNDARQDIQKLQEGRNFKIGCLGPAHIAAELLKRPYLLKEFPLLHVNKIDETLQSIEKALVDNSDLTTGQATKIMESGEEVKDKEKIKEKIFQAQAANVSSNAIKENPRKTVSEDFNRVLEISKSDLSSGDISALKIIVYSSKDPVAILQAVLAVVSGYKYSRTTDSEILSLTDIGIDTARAQNALDSEAVLLAEKASVLSTQFCLLDLEGWGSIEMGNRIGLQLMTQEEKDAIVTKLKYLNKEFNALFKEAAEKSVKSNNYLAVTRVFSQIGSAAGQRAGHFKSLNIKERAEAEERMAKSSFMYAKSVCSSAGDEGELVYILHNFANMLGFIGEKDEALGVLTRCLELAKKHNMTDVLAMAKDLERVIKEPKINVAKEF